MKELLIIQTASFACAWIFFAFLVFGSFSPVNYYEEEEVSLARRITWLAGCFLTSAGLFIGAILSLIIGIGLVYTPYNYVVGYELFTSVMLFSAIVWFLGIQPDPIDQLRPFHY
ncbi:hypothetical protein GOV04_02225 [Candidatus Woesearchaeota archaeon]|nr:hypothetical protein [Candidatus Woesearchaeota archaeon]